MKEIKKKGLERIICAHTVIVDQIQTIVNEMSEVGFEIGTKELIDLGNSCESLYTQAEELAAKDAKGINITSRRKQLYNDNIEYLRSIIFKNSQILSNVLRRYGSNEPLVTEAFEIKEGTVSISASWKKAKEEEYTITPTKKREQAITLVQNVENAINELNSFVADNPYFGRGISTSQDSRRVLCWLDGEGGFHEEKENYEFI